MGCTKSLCSVNSSLLCSTIHELKLIKCSTKKGMICMKKNRFVLNQTLWRCYFFQGYLKMNSTCPCFPTLDRIWTIILANLSFHSISMRSGYLIHLNLLWAEWELINWSILGGVKVHQWLLSAEIDILVLMLIQTGLEEVFIPWSSPS